MATATPVKRSSRGGLRRVVAAGELDVSGAQEGDLTRTASFATSKLNAIRESILLVADTMAGKSYAYMRMALKAFEDEDNWETKDDKNDNETRTYVGPKFFIFDFDDTSPTFMTDGYEFSHLYAGNGGNVYPFYCPTWEDSLKTLNTIRRDCKRGDWIIFDVIARLYEQSQGVIGKKVGKDVDEAVVQNITKGRGFGAFDPGEWNAVTRTFMSIYDRCFRTTQCHILTLSHLRDVVSVRSKRETLVMFHDLGLEPVAPPKVPGMQNSIVFLWNIRRIPRDERKREIPGAAKTIRNMTVVKDRGESYYYTAVYNRDFYDILEDERRSGAHKPVNITDPDEVEAIKADDSGGGLLDGSGGAEDPTSEDAVVDQAPTTRGSRGARKVPKK